MPPPELPPPVVPHDQVGSASMLDDGRLNLRLRSVLDDGSIAEVLMVIAPGEPRYDSTLTHLGGLKPGESCPIKPFPPAAHGDNDDDPYFDADGDE